MTGSIFVKKFDEMEEYNCVLLKICYNKILHICHISYNTLKYENGNVSTYGVRIS